MTSIVIYLPYRLTPSDATRRRVFVYVVKEWQMHPDDLAYGLKNINVFYSTFTNVFIFIFMERFFYIYGHHKSHCTLMTLPMELRSHLRAFNRKNFIND